MISRRGSKAVAVDDCPRPRAAVDLAVPVLEPEGGLLAVGTRVGLLVDGRVLVGVSIACLPGQAGLCGA